MAEVADHNVLVHKEMLDFLWDKWKYHDDYAHRRWTSFWVLTAAAIGASILVLQINPLGSDSGAVVPSTYLFATSFLIFSAVCGFVREIVRTI